MCTTVMTLSSILVLLLDDNFSSVLVLSSTGRWRSTPVEWALCVNVAMNGSGMKWPKCKWSIDACTPGMGLPH
eukprot:1160604-Pelagomonas_calceolata.AAC.3